MSRLLVGALALIGLSGAFLVFWAAVVAAQPDARMYWDELLVFAGCFAVLSFWLVRLPSGAAQHAGVVFSTSSMFLLPPLLTALVPVVGMALLAARHRRRWWAYPLTFGHGALSLCSGALVYRWLAPAEGVILPGMLPAGLAALAVHEVVQWLVSAIILAHRHGRSLAGQLQIVLSRDLNWATLGINLLGITAAVAYNRDGVWGLALQTLLLISLYQAIDYFTQVRIWQQTALTDGLTGAGNRTAWESFSQAIRNSARPLSGTLMVIDLDGLKRVNDQFGHATGDRVLRDLVERIRGCLRKSDRLFRYGGDEFIIFIPHDGQGDGMVRERMITVMSQYAHDWEGRGYPVDASMGMATAPQEAGRLEELFALADARMYAQKNARRPRTGAGTG